MNIYIYIVICGLFFHNVTQVFFLSCWIDLVFMLRVFFRNDIAGFQNRLGTCLFFKKKMVSSHSYCSFHRYLFLHVDTVWVLVFVESGTIR